MTIEEAIEKLTEIKEYYTPERDFSQYGEDYEPLTESDKEAINTAIKALEKQNPLKLHGTRCPVCKRALRPFKITKGCNGEIRKEVRDYLDRIDPYISTMLRLHYVEGRQWRYIAIRQGGGNTRDSVRKMCHRYITKNP